MKIQLTKPIERGEWLKALQAEAMPEEALSRKLDEAEAMLMAAAVPKGIYRLMDRQTVKLPGRSIQRHLEDCPRIVVLGLTLGMEIDRLLTRTQITDMAMAVLLDSGASLLAEQACNQLEEIIREQIRNLKEPFATPRFSPGYGDFPIGMQREMIRWIDGQRKIGLNVTKDSLMVPRKSITAIMGLADHPVKGHLATCGECVLRETCSLRKKGEFCGN